MKTSILILSIAVLAWPGPSFSQQEVNEDVLNLIRSSLTRYTSPGPLSAVDFSNNLYNHFFSAYSWFREDRYLSISERFSLEAENNTNQRSITTVFFFHDMIKGNGVANESYSGFLKIPYFWNWIKPNPRFGIVRLPELKTLKELPPPKGWGPYKNWAYVDRFPTIFFSDLFSKSVGYRSSWAGDFYTFGWCSEREPAYLIWLTSFDIQGIVIGRGGHVQSTVLVPVVTDRIGNKHLKMIVDNTFDEVSGVELCQMSNDDIKEWIRQADTTGSRYQKRYNSEAHSQKNKYFFSSFKVPPIVQERIAECVFNKLSTAFDILHNNPGRSKNACLENALQ